MWAVQFQCWRHLLRALWLLQDLRSVCTSCHDKNAWFRWATRDMISFSFCCSSCQLRVPCEIYYLLSVFIWAVLFYSLMYHAWANFWRGYNEWCYCHYDSSNDIELLSCKMNTSLVTLLLPWMPFREFPSVLGIVYWSTKLVMSYGT